MSEDSPAYTLSIDLPGSPKGELVQIPGLGEFENGSSYTISQGEADRYRAHHQKATPVYGDDGSIQTMEVEDGPTLLQASKSMYGVEVETAGGNNNPQRQTPTPTPNNADDNNGGGGE